MEELVELLREKGLSISSCESLTGGLFASTIASVPGASRVFQGALITYQNEIKIKVAHVEKEIIERYGAVSSQCAVSMAHHARKILEADICVSFTGNAGPDTMEGKEAGLVFCSIVGPIGIQSYEFHLKKERNELRKDIIERMCQKTIDYVNAIKK